MFGEDAWMQCGSDPFDIEYESAHDGYYGYNHRKKKRDFVPNPLHYHTLVRFYRIVKKTPKAYLFIIDGFEVWFPKTWVRELDSGSRVCYIWTEGYENKMDEIFASGELPCNVRHVVR